MIRKMIRNTVLLAAGAGMVIGLNAYAYTPAKAADAYKDTAVAGIDAAIEQYVLNHPDATVSTEAVANDPLGEATTEAVTEEAPVSTARYPKFENKLMANVSDYMNIRAEADENSDVVGKLPHGAVADVLEQGDTWTKIESGSVTGYVKNELVVFGDDAGDYAEANCDKIATVTTTTLKVREEANADSTCLTMIPEGETYEVLETADGWTKLLISEEFSGYVSNEFIEIDYDLGKAISKEEEEAEAARQAELARQEQAQAAQASQAASQPAPAATPSAPAAAPQVDTSVVSGSRADLVNYALQFLGNPYVYGGTSLTNGADCSGFTQSVFAHFGITTGRSSRDQAAKGKEISMSAIQPGDLLFYASGNYINHVAIYIGDGKIIHSSNPTTGITITKYNYRTPCKAVTFLN